MVSQRFPVIQEKTRVMLNGTRNSMRRPSLVVTGSLLLVLVLSALGLFSPMFAGDVEQAETRSFEQSLEDALVAQKEGRLGDARASLREATRRVVGIDEQDQAFHGMLLDAADEFDRGELRASRGRLKAATQSINPWFWLILGFVAQGFFTARFIVQWLASEREGRSVIPLAFWYFSLLGSGGLLAYAIWRQDPVIVLGQAFNAFIYLRNLALLRRAETAASPVAATDGEST